MSLNDSHQFKKDFTKFDLQYCSLHMRRNWFPRFNYYNVNGMHHLRRICHFCSANFASDLLILFKASLNVLKEQAFAEVI